MFPPSINCTRRRTDPFIGGATAKPAFTASLQGFRCISGAAGVAGSVTSVHGFCAGLRAGCGTRASLLLKCALHCSADLSDVGLWSCEGAKFERRGSGIEMLCYMIVRFIACSPAAAAHYRPLIASYVSA